MKTGFPSNCERLIILPVNPSESISGSEKSGAYLLEVVSVEVFAEDVTVEVVVGISLADVEETDGGGAKAE